MAEVILPQPHHFRCHTKALKILQLTIIIPLEAHVLNGADNVALSCGMHMYTDTAILYKLHACEWFALRGFLTLQSCCGSRCYG